MIRGIGEKFTANSVTGTGSLTILITTSPGRSGFGPQLSLSYDSGAGNGPFGFGWSFALPSISYKTDKGLLMKPERVRGLDHLGDDWSRYLNTYQPKREATKPSSVLWSFGGLIRTQKYDAMQRTASIGPRFLSAFLALIG